MRYKPWRTIQNDVLGNDFDETIEGWTNAWHAFVLTDYAKIKIPSWNNALNKARTQMNNSQDQVDDEPLNMQEDDDIERTEIQQDYMRIQSNRTDVQRRADNYLNVMPNQVLDPLFWQQDRHYYTDLEIAEMTDWIPHQIRADPTERNPIIRPIVDVSSLNTMQLRAYNLVQRRIQSNTQLLIRIEGEGGTGKSHLINAICNLIPPGAFRVCAPTGKAAHLIGAVTIHKLMNINPMLPKPELDLKPTALAKLQNNFEGVTHIICDEFSMVGAKILYIIDSRCRQATGNLSLLFGGLSILLFGDTKQLPPVFDTPLWHSNPPTQVATVISGLASFKQFKLVIRLTQNHRQVDPTQVQFKELLGRLRNGKSLFSDWGILRNRIKGLADNEAEFEDSLYLMYSKAQVHEYNMTKVNQLANSNPLNRACRIDALHEGTGAQSMKSDDFLGLYPYLVLSRNARVMLISNQWIKKGLTNGAMGTIRHFIFAVGSSPPALPISIIVEMDEGYTGPHLANKPRHVPFDPITAFKENDSGRMLERTQLPFILAFAITIHKCQGS